MMYVVNKDSLKQMINGGSNWAKVKVDFRFDLNLLVVYYMAHMGFALVYVCSCLRLQLWTGVWHGSMNSLGDLAFNCCRPSEPKKPLSSPPVCLVPLAERVSQTGKAESRAPSLWWEREGLGGMKTAVRAWWKSLDLRFSHVKVQMGLARPISRTLPLISPTRYMNCVWTEAPESLTPPRLIELSGIIVPFPGAR